MKKCVIFLLAAALFCVLAGCEQTRIVHCDRCGNEIEVPSDSDITEDWILHCNDCEREMGY